MQVADLVARFAEAAAGTDPMGGARALAEELSGDLDGLGRLLAYVPGTGGNANQAFYRAPNLSLLKVSFPSGRRTPPHDHGAWAVILVISGRERNTLYRRGPDGRLRRVSEVQLEPGSILPLRPDAVHVAECIGVEPALGLHVYGANVLGVARHMWDPDTLEELPLEWTRYEQLAQRASRAASAPLSGS